MQLKRHDISKRIRDRGMTVRGWATLNGFSPPFVFNFIYGAVGKRATTPRAGKVTKAIYEALKRDGLINEQEA